MSKAKREKRKQSAARRRAMKATDGSLPYRMPEGVTRFKFKPGKYKVNVLGFKAGKGNPDADPGEWVDSRIYFAHKKVGGSDDMAICPMKTAGKKCPLCEKRSKEEAKRKGRDDELIEALKPQKRQALLIQQIGSDEVELIDVAEYNFGKRLNADLGNCDEEEGHDEFFRHTTKTGGRTIKFSLADIATKDFNYTGCEAVKFMEREEEIDEDVLKKVVCLDDVIAAAVPSYEDLKNKLTLGEEEDEDDDDKDEDDKDEDEDDEDEDDEDEDDKPKKIGKKSSKVDKEEEDEDEDEEDEDEEDEDEEDEVDFKKGDLVEGIYKKKKFKGKVKKIVNGLVQVETNDGLRTMNPDELTIAKKAKDEDDDEGEEDEDDESESKGKSSKKSGKSSKGSSKKASKEEDEDEDDEDEDDDIPFDDEDEEDEDEDEDEEEDDKPKKNKKKK